MSQAVLVVMALQEFSGAFTEAVVANMYVTLVVFEGDVSALVSAEVAAPLIQPRSGRSTPSAVSSMLSSHAKLVASDYRAEPVVRVTRPIRGVGVGQDGEQESSAEQVSHDSLESLWVCLVVYVR